MTRVSHRFKDQLMQQLQLPGTRIMVDTGARTIILLSHCAFTVHVLCTPEQVPVNPFSPSESP